MKKDYDKTLTRLISILTQLSNDERYTTKEFAEEHSVSVRTIQKDFKDRLGNFFSIEKDSLGRHKFMSGVSINKSSLSNDEMMLVSLALSQFKDVSNFDKLTNSSLKKLLNPKIFNPYFVKQDDLEDIDIDSKIVETLEKAIQDQNHVQLKVLNNTLDVEPYKISNFDGIWYLFAKDENDKKTKTFMLSKIKKVIILRSKHITSQDQIDQSLKNVHSAWFEDGSSFKVIIKVSNNISYYFKHKEFLQSQIIEEECKDGSLIVSFEVSHDEDIDNIIKSWLPEIYVIEPVRYKEKIKKELEEYLKRID